MPKLYYTPTSCGAASFIAAYAANVSLDCEVVDIRSHTTASGKNFYEINAKGNVPALVLDDGTVLNEGAAVLQWIADQAPGKIAPVYGSTERYLVQQFLNYTASEVHSCIGGLFHPEHNDATRAFYNKLISKRLTYLNDNVLPGKEFLVGSSFSISDSYLYIVLSWTPYVGVDLTPYPVVKAYFERIGGLKFVQEAHARMSTSPATTC